MWKISIMTWVAVTDQIQIKIKDWATMKVINLLRRRDRVVPNSFTVIPVVSPPTCCVHCALSVVGFQITWWSEWCITCLCRGPCPNKHRLINSDLLKILNLLFVYFYTLEKYKHDVSAMVFNELQAVRVQILNTYNHQPNTTSFSFLDCCQ
jgi:hypothetical protein